MALQFVSIFAVWLAIAGAVRGQTAVNAPTGVGEGEGEIAFKQVIKDFGTLKRGEKGVADFPFENVGKGLLIIQGVHASCGCVAVEGEDGRLYASGDHGSIKVTIDTTNFSGPLVKMVTVMTNEKLLPSRTLTVKVHVEDEVSAFPPVVDFGPIRSGTGPTKRVVVRPVGSLKQVTVDKLQFNTGVFAATVAQAGDVWNIDIKLNEGVQPGSIRETLFVHNNSKSLPDLPVLVRAEVVGNIRAQPPYLEFGAVAPHSHATKSVELSGVASFDLTGSWVELNVNGEPIMDAATFVKIGTAKGTTDKKVPVELHNNGKAGSVHGRLVFLTSDALQKEVGFDFYAFFQE